MAEIKIDDLKPVKSEEAQEPTPHEKAAEKLKQAARALCETQGNIAPTPEQAKQAIEAGEKYAIYSLDEIAAMDEAERELLAKQHDINVLRAELTDKVAELRDMKKTISKMQQTHEVELQDLKDQLGEAQAAAEAAKKAHAHAVGEKNNYADSLDNDSIAFEEIRALAIIMDRNAKSLQELAKMVRERTEV